MHQIVRDIHRIKGLYVHFVLVDINALPIIMALYQDLSTV
jgi:hypothetical protein